jgi:segregation and condensation protein B
MLERTLAMPDKPHDLPTTPEDLGRTYAELLADRMTTAAPRIEEPAIPPPALRIVEALLFVGGSPLTAKRAREILRGLTQDQFDEAVVQLNADYRRQARPYALTPQGAGWVLTLKPRFRHVIDKLYGGVREARLSTAAIDVLALVAYQQPITKADVDSVRGADSGAILRQLVRRGLIHIMPLPAAPRREVAYATTPRFLEMFGLQSLDDLPKTHDLQQI